MATGPNTSRECTAGAAAPGSTSSSTGATKKPLPAGAPTGLHLGAAEDEPAVARQLVDALRARPRAGAAVATGPMRTPSWAGLPTVIARRRSTRSSRSAVGATARAPARGGWPCTSGRPSASCRAARPSGSSRRSRCPARRRGRARPRSGCPPPRSRAPSCSITAGSDADRARPVSLEPVKATTSCGPRCSSRSPGAAHQQRQRALGQHLPSRPGSPSCGARPAPSWWRACSPPACRPAAPTPPSRPGPRRGS